MTSNKKATPKLQYTMPRHHWYGIDYNSEYIGGKVNSIDYHYVYSRAAGKDKITSIRDYCLDRWIRKCLNLNDFNCIGVSGYYGDETEVHLDSEKLYQYEGFIGLLNKDMASDTQIVEEVLRKEYGYVLPWLKNKTWKFCDKVNVNLIHSTRLDDDNSVDNMFVLDRGVVEKYKENLTSQYIKERVLSCMCIKQGDNYRIIDGNHRLVASREVLLEKLAAHKRGKKPKVFMSVVYCE